MLPSLFNLVIYFILTLFSISYSISLFKILFLKKNYNLSNITKKYIKILGVSLLFNLLSSIIEVFKSVNLHLIFYSRRHIIILGG